MVDTEQRARHTIYDIISGADYLPMFVIGDLILQLGLLRQLPDRSSQACMLSIPF